MKKKENPDDDRTAIDNQEAKCEEVQAIIERMPVRHALWTALVTFTVAAVVLLLGFIIKYPDTVDGEISVTAFNAPVRLVANTRGRLTLLKDDRRQVQKGDIIGFLENGADLKDAMTVDSLISAYTEGDTGTELPDKLSLGEIGASYNDFRLAHQQYLLFVNSNLTKVKRTSLIEQIRSDSMIVENIDIEISVKKKLLEINRELLQKDSAVFNAKAMTESQLNERLTTFLTLSESYQNLLVNKTGVQARINKGKTDLEQLKEEEKDQKNQLLTEIAARRNNLLNTLNVWKERYLFIASVPGVLEYLGFWRNNTFINGDQEVFSIIPNKNRVIGEVVIPTQGSGKVKPGQNVNVKLSNFPYDEYGLLSGKVSGISNVPHKIATPDGSMDTYLVEVIFPEGTVTNYGRKLELSLETKGIAEIITEPKRLIERLFDNLKARTVK